MKDDRAYAEHIIVCLDRIARYTHAGRDAFMADSMIQDAVIRNLQTLAESSRRLSSGFQSRCPQVDWKSVAGFRNVVVHDYLGLDLGQIWDVVVSDLPSLRECIEKNRGPV